MADEDSELKDVLIRSLSENGILPKIQAQLRAAIYVALENHNFEEFLKPSNETFRSFMSCDDGLLVTSLVVDFLSKMKLDNTLEVFKVEADLEEKMLMSPAAISSQICNSTNDKERPLIAQFLSEYLPTASQTSDSKSRTDCQSFSSNKRQAIPNGSITNGPDDRQPSILLTNDKACSGQQQQLQSSRSASNLSNASSDSRTTIPHQQNGSVSRTGATGDYDALDGEEDVRNSSHRTPSVKTSEETGGLKHPQSVSKSGPTPAQSSVSPRDQVGHSNAYQDDFDSPPSSESAESNTVTPTTTGSLHFNSEGVNSGRHQLASSQGSSTPRDAGRLSKTPASETSSHPVIRVYMQTSPRRRRPGQEESSDIDEDGPEEMEEPTAGEECAPITRDVLQRDAAEQSVGATGMGASEPAGMRRLQSGSARLADEDEAAVDQTINSDDSLSLDHAEDVLPQTTWATRGRR